MLRLYLLLASLVALVACSTQAAAAPCDQPGYVYMRHLWPSNKVYKQPYGVIPLNQTDQQPLLQDINAIKAACDADERCTIFTTNGRLLGLAPVQTLDNKTDINFSWRRYYCGPCNYQDAQEILYNRTPWPGSGCCGSITQDAQVPRTPNFFTPNQNDTNGKRCCGSYIAAGVHQALPHLAKDVTVETPFQATSRIDMDFAEAQGMGGPPCAVIKTYSANAAHCSWLRHRAGKHPTCCPACIEMLCKRVDAAHKQQGPALEKAVAAFSTSAVGSGVAPCCRPVFTVHSNEEEFYCAALCGASQPYSPGSNYGSGFSELRVEFVDTDVEQWTPNLKVISAVTKMPCPVACNSSTRGVAPYPGYVCGAEAPGMSRVAQQYMFLKSKGLQGQPGRAQNLKKKQCTKSGDAFLC